METEDLRISEYSRVTFESTAIERDSANQLRVKGTLTIQTRVPGLKPEVMEIQQPRSRIQAETEAEAEIA